MSCKYLNHQLCVRTTGEFRLCCASLEPSHEYNIKTHTIEQWLNSDIHKNAKLSVDNGILPDSCLRCKSDEDSGITSMRQRPEQFGPGLSHLDIRFSNQCNLRCVMCNPKSSSSILQEHINLGDSSPWGTIQVEEYNWYNTDIATEISKINTLKEVYLTGGEPFMVKGLDKFIDKLDRKVNLRFNTNGTLNNKKLYNLLREFENVNLAFSIDGIGKVNDYIRYGSTWNEVEDNLLLCKEYKFDVNITPTIQIYNYPYIQELWDYASRHDINVYDTLLINPKYLDIRHMPDNMRIKYMLDKHVEYFKNNHSDDSQIKQLVEFTKTLDNSRNINISDYLPEVCEFYDFS